MFSHNWEFKSLIRNIFLKRSCDPFPCHLPRSMKKPHAAQQPELPKYHYAGSTGTDPGVGTSRGSPDLPPLNHVRLIVPVLPGSVCVHIRVNSGPARHRSRHIRQLGRRKRDVKSEATCSAVLTEEKGLRFLHLQTEHKPEVKFSRYFKSI